MSQRNSQIMYIVHLHEMSNPENSVGGVLVSVLSSSAEDRGFDSRSGQTKDYQIGICCSTANHTSLGRKSKN
jgi:hypothetical protein